MANGPGRGTSRGTGRRAGGVANLFGVRRIFAPKRPKVFNGVTRSSALIVGDALRVGGALRAGGALRVVGEIMLRQKHHYQRQHYRRCHHQHC